jgi:hypothetical protein
VLDFLRAGDYRGIKEEHSRQLFHRRLAFVDDPLNVIALVPADRLSKASKNLLETRDLILRFLKVA